VRPCLEKHICTILTYREYLRLHKVNCKSYAARRHFTLLINKYLQQNKANYYNRTKIKVTYKNIQPIQASLL